MRWDSSNRYYFRPEECLPLRLVYLTQTIQINFCCGWGGAAVTHVNMKKLTSPNHKHSNSCPELISHFSAFVQDCADNMGKVEMNHLQTF